MMTLTEIKQHNAARRRALQEKKALEQQPQPEPEEEVRKEIKGRRPKNRRALVVEEIEEPVQEEIQEEVREEIPQPEAPEIEPQEEGE